MDVVGVVEVMRVPYKPSPANWLDIFLVNIIKILFYTLYSLLGLLGNRSESVNKASQTSFSSSPPRPKKEEKSVVPVWSGRSKPAPRSLFIWGGGLAANQSDFCEALRA